MKPLPFYIAATAAFLSCISAGLAQVSVAPTKSRSAKKSGAHSGARPNAHSGARPNAHSGARPNAHSGAKPNAHSGAKPRRGSKPAKTGANSQGPNVLFIAIDDMRPEIGTYGAKTITPNIDRLAARGVRFDRAYCQQAVCGASRVSLLSGLYPTMTGEQTFHVAGWRKRHPDLVTMNQHFGQQGYQTIGMGKIYHGAGGPGVDPDNWQRWIRLSADEYAKAENQNIRRKALAARQVGDSRDPAKGPLTESANVADDTYLDGKRAAKAVEILENMDRSKPFFLAVGFNKPHLPFVAPKKYWDLYQRQNFSMPDNQAIPPGYPPRTANLRASEMHKYSDFEGQGPADFSVALQQRLLHGYAAATSYADACVGRVLDALEQNGLAKNTIVVVWGDHGWKLGDHGSWTKHTNFECDTRVPLIIRDPRITNNQNTKRLVELIDLYPTLCNLTGIPVPPHCQGRSLHKLLKDPEAGHRLDAYSSYPFGKQIGHSLRFSNYRYTEVHDQDGTVKAKVLTNLAKDPGEVTNVIDVPRHREALDRGTTRLALRIKQARNAAPKRKTPRPTTATPRKRSVRLDVQPKKLRQTIDGFGGSIAFWGTRADDEALKAAIQGLKVRIVRVQGEVSKLGVNDHNRDILQRAMQLNPKLEVLLTFWQPRSIQHLSLDDWLEIRTVGKHESYALKPQHHGRWAKEIVARIQTFRDWGINVTTIGVQNESNWSHIDTQTCVWEPAELRTFIETELQPRLKQAQLDHLKIAAPDLAYIGPEADEVDRYLPAITSPAVDVVAYHMYDSYTEGNSGSLQTLIDNTRILGTLRRQHFADKKVWMTETTGAQWNGEQWHTYGWTPGLTEHDKAIKAARYIHTTFVDAGANAFLWWGLLYSTAPEKVTDPNRREKHRDEGLVLVRAERENGYQPFLARTKKYYVFRQYSGFIHPGYRRVHLASPNDLQVSAFCSPDQNTVVAVVVNDTDQEQPLKLSPPSNVSTTEAWQTDAAKNCEPVKPRSKLPRKSVRTLVYQR